LACTKCGDNGESLTGSLLSRQTNTGPAHQHCARENEALSAGDGKLRYNHQLS
jgi:hypothetical protein